MLIRKPKKLIFSMFLVLLGMGYFSAMSSLEINFFFRGYAALMPMQAVALVYVMYLRWSSR